MKKKITIWFYVSLLPAIFAIFGMLISAMAHLHDWGESRDASTIITVFFCEITFVISVLGLLSYMFQTDKTPWVKRIRWINTSLIIVTLGLSVYFFLR